MSDKSKRCVLFMTFRPSQRTLFMAQRNWVPLALSPLNHVICDVCAHMFYVSVMILYVLD